MHGQSQPAYNIVSVDILCSIPLRTQPTLWVHQGFAMIPCTWYFTAIIFTRFGKWNIDTRVNKERATHHRAFEWCLGTNRNHSWWRYQMETFSALLDICAGNSPVPGEFPTQRPVTRSFDVYFDLRPNKRVSKQLWGWWFETQSHPLWRHVMSSHRNLEKLFTWQWARCLLMTWHREVLEQLQEQSWPSSCLIFIQRRRVSMDK